MDRDRIGHVNAQRERSHSTEAGLDVLGYFLCRGEVEISDGELADAVSGEGIGSGFSDSYCRVLVYFDLL